MVPEARAHLVRRWLQQFCRPDPEFPSALVWTVYYDTPGLTSLSEKLNSDFLKQKVRVRWYSDSDGHPSGAVFVEAKIRVGSRRAKVRARLPHRAEDLAGWQLTDRRFAALPSALHEQGVYTAGAWQPLLQVRYRRDRFVEPASQSRISFDSDIAATAVNPALMSPQDRSPLGTAVLEVKGLDDELPAALTPLLAFGLHKRSFSKFLSIYVHAAGQIL